MIIDIIETIESEPLLIVPEGIEMLKWFIGTDGYRLLIVPEGIEI